MGYLNNVNIPQHKQKLRDPKYLAKIDSLFEQFKEALEINSIDCKILKFTDVNDQMVGFVHDFFLNTKGYSNKTYNNNMGLLSGFTTHVINRFNFQNKNPFLGVPDMIVNPKVTSIRENEFEKLLEMVTPENGIQMQSIRTRKKFKKN